MFHVMSHNGKGLVHRSSVAMAFWWGLTQWQHAAVTNHCKWCSCAHAYGDSHTTGLVRGCAHVASIHFSHLNRSDILPFQIPECPSNTWVRMKDCILESNVNTCSRWRPVKEKKLKLTINNFNSDHVITYNSLLQVLKEIKWLSNQRPLLWPWFYRTQQLIMREFTL